MHQEPFTKGQRFTDASGAMTATVIEVDPFGGETARSANSAFQARKYTSYTRDNDGSDDAMHRRYSAVWSRFSQPDPYDGSYNFTDPQSFNRYSYVQNDPVNLVDPSGLKPCQPGDYHAECDSSGFGGWGGGFDFSVPWSSDPRPGLSGIARRTFTSSWVDTENDVIRFYTVAPYPDLFEQATGLIWRPGTPKGRMRNPRVLDKKSRGEAERQKRVAACFDESKVAIDAAREKFRAGAGRRILIQGGIGAVRGIIMGAIGGAAGGGVFFGVGAVPGAILGGVVGGIFGAAAGVITGGFVAEPAMRNLYNHFDYQGALQQARKYCDATS